MTLAEAGITVRGLYRSEYERLVESGVFDDERVELIDGEVVTMSPIGKGHVQVVARLTRLIVRQLPDGWMVAPQSSFAASTRSQPEPDLAVIRDESWELPTAAALIVEVSESSRKMDLEIKPGVYAAARVPVYAVLDLRDRVLHVHTDPVDGEYTAVSQLRPGEPLTIVDPPLTVDIASVLPPA